VSVEEIEDEEESFMKMKPKLPEGNPYVLMGQSEFRKYLDNNSIPAHGATKGMGTTHHNTRKHSTS